MVTGGRGYIRIMGDKMSTNMKKDPLVARVETIIRRLEKAGFVIDYNHEAFSSYVNKHRLAAEISFEAFIAMDCNPTSFSTWAHPTVKPGRINPIINLACKKLGFKLMDTPTFYLLYGPVYNTGYFFLMIGKP